MLTSLLKMYLKCILKCLGRLIIYTTDWAAIMDISVPVRYTSIDVPGITLKHK